MDVCRTKPEVCHKKHNSLLSTGLFKKLKNLNNMFAVNFFVNKFAS